MKKKAKRTLKTALLIGLVTISANILLVFTLSSNSYGLEWEKTFGGSSYDYGYSVQQTTDGGFIIAGYTDSYGAGGNDVYLIKTDGSGNELWSKTFGGSSGDYGRSVQQTTDGGYIIAGHTGSFGAGGSDFYLIKTDAAGNKTWSRTFGGSSEDLAYSVQQTTDGGYIIAGYKWQDSGWNTYLVKTDALGIEDWNKIFARAGSIDHGSSVRQTKDGGYIILGTAQASNYWDDVYLLKTDSSGNELWSKTFGGDFEDHGSSVQQTEDGGYIIAGNTNSSDYPWHDVYLIKTDMLGNQQWSRTFGSIYDEYGYSVRQTDDGGYILAGQTDSYDIGSGGIYLVKTDDLGREIWSKTFGDSYTTFGSSVQQTEDGGYIITGTDYRNTKSYDAFLAYYNPKLLDIFGFEIGNSWKYEGVYQGSPYTAEREITAIETNWFPVPTYTFEIKENGSNVGAEWYENTGNEIKLWGTTALVDGYYYTLFFSQGLTAAWFPMEVNDHKFTSATTDIEGIQFDVNFTVDVIRKTSVPLSFATLEAYEVYNQLHVWGSDPWGTNYDIRDNFTTWVVPYLGVVKEIGDDYNLKLTSFAIGGGHITPVSDADGDGLQGYQEILTYGTDWQNSDSENDGMPDGWEVNYGLNPLVDDANDDKDDDGFTNLIEYLKGYDPIDPKSHPVISMPWLLLLLG
jgi:hypothetical protein